MNFPIDVKRKLYLLEHTQHQQKETQKSRNKTPKTHIRPLLSRQFDISPQIDIQAISMGIAASLIQRYVYLMFTKIPRVGRRAGIDDLHGDGSCSWRDED